MIEIERDERAPARPGGLLLAVLFGWVAVLLLAHVLSWACGAAGVCHG